MESTSLLLQVVSVYLAHIVKGQVKRYELPGISGFNFVCTQALGGGGLSKYHYTSKYSSPLMLFTMHQGSLHIDRQGKCYAQMLLSLPIDVPVEWAQDYKQSKL